MKKLVFLLCTLIPLMSLAQLGEVNHWETVIPSNSTWKYMQFDSASEVHENWYSIDFDSVWQTGTMPFSSNLSEVHNTLADAKQSIFLRKTFVVSDTTEIKTMIFECLYKDGINIFLNGYKVYSEGMNGSPYYANPSDTSLYPLPPYTKPKQYIPLESDLHRALRNDTNVIAIQLHTHKVSSSYIYGDISVHAGMHTSSTQFESLESNFSIPPLYTLTSNLPIIRINTYDQMIVPDTAYQVRMYVNFDSTATIYNYSDTGSHYNDWIRLKIRGQSSKEFPKKSYTMGTRFGNMTDQNVRLLNLPIEHDFVLNGPYADKSYLRNVLTYDIWNKMGHYAPRTRFVELFLNEYYNGVYVLMERIKRDKNRVAVNRLNKDEVDNNGLTGGYIMKIDKQPIRGFDAWKSGVEIDDSLEYMENTIHFVYPDDDDITYEQKNYIISHMEEFEKILLDENFKDEQYGYKNYIDLNSWVDYLLMTELSKDIDSYKYSMYFYKKKASEGGQIYMGPAWDYNYGYGVVSTDISDYIGPVEQWAYDQTFRRVFWFDRMMQDTSFNHAVRCRWQSLRSSFLHTDSINNFIDTQVDYIEEEVAKSLYKWDQLDRYIYPNLFVSSSYEEEVNFLRDWTIDRMEWMDQELAIEGCIEVKEMNGERITAFPNPATSHSQFQIDIDAAGYYNLALYDTQGVLIQSIESGYLDLGINAYRLEFNDIQKGAYWIVCEKDQAVYASKQIMIQ